MQLDCEAFIRRFVERKQIILSDLLRKWDMNIYIIIYLSYAVLWFDG